VTRTRNEALVEQARILASLGKTQREVSAELGVKLRTLQSWPVDWPMGRPRVGDEQASARTARRRRQEKGTGMTQPENLEKQLDALRDQGVVPLHQHEAGDPCDERCVPVPLSRS
jgi:hypothetical protein